jgi:hypothetical protein
MRSGHGWGVARHFLVAALLAGVAVAAHGAARVLLDTTNGAAVQSGPTAAATFRLAAPAHVVRITNYHWNDGKGARPGLIGLRDEASGKQIGAWQAKGAPGQGGVADAYWIAEPAVTLGPGLYRVTDGDVGTWSRNAQSGQRGFTRVEAVAPPKPRPAVPPSQAPAQPAPPPLPAAGAASADPPPAAAPRTLQSQRVFVAALRLRSLAARSLADGVAQTPGGHVLDFLRESREGRELPEAWAMLFAGSVVLVGGVQTPAPIVAFYNPWLDAALLTRWALVDDVPAVEAAALWIASDFPSAAADGIEPVVARWLHDSGTRPAPQALQQRFAAFVAAFDRAFPLGASQSADIAPTGGRAAAVPFVAGQARHALAGVVGVQRPSSPLYRPDLRRFLAALRGTDPAALRLLLPDDRPEAVEALFALPPELRQRLVPVHALARPGGPAVVFLGLPETPRFYLMVTLPAGADGRVAAVSVHDLAPSQEGK